MRWPWVSRKRLDVLKRKAFDLRAELLAARLQLLEAQDVLNIRLARDSEHRAEYDYAKAFEDGKQLGITLQKSKQAAIPLDALTPKGGLKKDWLRWWRTCGRQEPPVGGS